MTLPLHPQYAEIERFQTPELLSMTASPSPYGFAVILHICETLHPQITLDVSTRVECSYYLEDVGTGPYDLWGQHVASVDIGWECSSIRFVHEFPPNLQPLLSQVLDSLDLDIRSLDVSEDEMDDYEWRESRCAKGW